MENNGMDQSPAVVVGRPGIMRRIIMVFSDPGHLFRSLTGKADWLVPLIIVAFLGGGVGFMLRPIYSKDMRPMLEQNIEKYRAQIGEQRYNEIKSQIEKGFQEAEQNPFKWYYILTALLYPFISFVIIAAIGFVAGGFIFGGKANFWVVMNVIAYAALIGLLGDLVRGILMLTKNTMFIYTGLGLLNKPGEGNFLSYLFQQIDIFSIWRIAVTAIGLGAIYEMKPKRFAYVLFSVWIVFIVAVAIGNMFTGGTIVY